MLECSRKPSRPFLFPKNRTLVSYQMIHIDSAIRNSGSYHKSVLVHRLGYIAFTDKSRVRFVRDPETTIFDLSLTIVQIQPGSELPNNFCCFFAAPSCVARSRRLLGHSAWQTCMHHIGFLDYEGVRLQIVLYNNILSYHKRLTYKHTMPLIHILIAKNDP